MRGQGYGRPQLKRSRRLQPQLGKPPMTGSSAFDFDRGSGERKFYLEPAAFSHLAGYVDSSVMLVRDAAHQGKTQPGAIAPRGIKRPKNLRKLRRGNAAAGIRDRDTSTIVPRPDHHPHRAA